MSDSLPTISAEQLTKSVSLAAAGTLTALDGENEECNDGSSGILADSEHEDKRNGTTSTIPTVKLLEALSSSVTSNLSKLRQLDNDDDALQALSSNLAMGRQRKAASKKTPTQQPALKKYSNRKNYKLKPPTIPSQFQSVIRQAQHGSVFERGRSALSLDARLVHPANQSAGFPSTTVKPVQLNNPRYMIVSPTKIQFASAVPSPQQVNNCQPFVGSVSVASQGKVEEKDVHQNESESKCVQESTVTPKTKQISTFMVSNKMSSTVPVFKLPYSANSVRKVPMGNSHQHGISQDFNTTKKVEGNRTTTSNTGEPNEKLDMPTLAGVKHLTINGSENVYNVSLTDQTSTISMATNNTPWIVQPNLTHLSQTTAANGSGLLASKGGKSTLHTANKLQVLGSRPNFVPILPSHPVRQLNQGQLLVQNSNLQVLHPNGCIQTIAFLCPTTSSGPMALGLASSSNTTNQNSVQQSSIRVHSANTCVKQSTSILSSLSEVSTNSSALKSLSCSVNQHVPVLSSAPTSLNADNSSGHSFTQLSPAMRCFPTQFLTSKSSAESMTLSHPTTNMCTVNKNMNLNTASLRNNATSFHSDNLEKYLINNTNARSPIPSHEKSPPMTRAVSELVSTIPELALSSLCKPKKLETPTQSIVLPSLGNLLQTIKTHENSPTVKANPRLASALRQSSKNVANCHPKHVQKHLVSKACPLNNEVLNLKRCSVEPNISPVTDPLSKMKNQTKTIDNDIALQSDFIGQTPKSVCNSEPFPTTETHTCHLTPDPLNVKAISESASATAVAAAAMMSLAQTDYTARELPAQASNEKDQALTLDQMDCSPNVSLHQRSIDADQTNQTECNISNNLENIEKQRDSSLTQSSHPLVDNYSAIETLSQTNCDMTHKLPNSNFKISPLQTHFNRNRNQSLGNENLSLGQSDSHTSVNTNKNLISGRSDSTIVNFQTSANTNSSSQGSESGTNTTRTTNSPSLNLLSKNPSLNFVSHTSVSSTVTSSMPRELLQPSSRGNTMILSPAGIKHLQSILRQRGISQGYFVITSPRTGIKADQNVKKNTVSPTPLQRDLMKEKPLFVPSISTKQDETLSCDQVTSCNIDREKSGFEEAMDCSEDDSTSSLSRSSSAALVIETGEEQEDSDSAPSAIESGDRQEKENGAYLSPHNDTLDKNYMYGNREAVNQYEHFSGQRNQENKEQDVEMVDGNEAVSNHVEDDEGKMQVSDPVIPQSPLSLSEIVRQHVSKDPTLNKVHFYGNLRSPAISTKDCHETPDQGMQNDDFVQPTGFSRQSISAYSSACQQSPLDGDCYRQNLFTPNSVYPVDLSYERDSQLASIRLTEEQGNSKQDPPSKNGISSSHSVPSPRSLCMSNTAPTDSVALINPPMTPNTMLINLLNRVPTPLLTSNPDSLTMPSLSQENQDLESTHFMKQSKASPEKRAPEVTQGKHCVFSDGHEYADNLSHIFLGGGKKVDDCGDDNFDPPQNALEMIASRCTPSSSSNAEISTVEQPVCTKLGDDSLHMKEIPNACCNGNSRGTHVDITNCMSCCSHLVVTVNLDSDSHSTSHVLPLSHNDVSSDGEQHALTTNLNKNHTLDFEAPAMSRIVSSIKSFQVPQSSADTEILRHLIVNTNLSSIYAHNQTARTQQFGSETHGDEPFNIAHNHHQQKVSQYLSGVDSYLSAPDKSVSTSSNRDIVSHISAFPDHNGSIFSHQPTSQPVCVFSDTSALGYTGSSSFPQTSAVSQLNSAVQYLVSEPSLILHPETNLEPTSYHLTSESMSKSKLVLSQDRTHMIEDNQLEHFSADGHPANSYYASSAGQEGESGITIDCQGQHYPPNYHLEPSSYERNDHLFGQTDQNTTLRPAVYTQASHPSSHHGLQSFSNTENSEITLQTFEHQNNHPQQFSQSGGEGDSLNTFNHPSTDLQSFEHLPHQADQQGSCRINSLSYENRPSGSHLYQNTAMPPHLDSSGLFPQQEGFIMNQVYPAVSALPFLRMGGVGGEGVDPAVSSMFSDQCAIGSEAPMLSAVSGCDTGYTGEAQGLQHIPQQFPYPPNQPTDGDRGTNLARSTDHHGSQHHGLQHPGGASEEHQAAGLEKQPVLPSASFSPPSVADQAVSQSDEHQFSGTIPNMSIYDLYLRGNSDAKTGPNEAEPLSGNFCVDCNTMYASQCKFHPCDYTYVTDTPILSHARLTLPACLKLGTSNVVGHTNTTGVFAKEKIAVRTKFGPLTGSPVSCDKLGSTRSFSLWQTFLGDNVKVVDTSDEYSSNWLMFVKPARVSLEQNLVAFQHGHSVYFVTRREVQPGDELLYWFARDYAKVLGTMEICRYLYIFSHTPPIKVLFQQN